MHFICSEKRSVQWLIKNLIQIEVQNIVISPGSRNAPLIISFANHPYFKCYNIVDERSAAFYAMGMAKQLGKPVALVCTSGSAVLNYAPAISEAFYQEIPLIVITADRPPELIDQEDGQTIHQENIYSNYIKASFSLPTCNKLEQHQNIEKLFEQFINAAVQIPWGPLHLNIPFNEPLYNTCTLEIENIKPFSSNNAIQHTLNDEQIALWQKAEKVLIICGLMHPDKETSALLKQLNQLKQVAILASPIANINDISCSTESVVYNSNIEAMLDFSPDLLITIGGPVVSKALKQFIRKHKPKNHWDIDTNPKMIDTYQCLTLKITSETPFILHQLLTKKSAKKTHYNTLWIERQNTICLKRSIYENNVAWSDFKVFSLLFKHINSPIDLHLANSTPVRYAELFDKHTHINYYSNRGTSGIDGSTSTAAGAAIISENITYLITGDLSFLYDSNALWNNHLPSNLKIIVINNQGGNIFKIIKGPADSAQIKQFQAHTPANIASLCKAYNINYLHANDPLSFTDALNQLKKNNNCTVLEVETDADISAQSYRDYFKHLMQ